jgi:O-antigen ligase
MATEWSPDSERRVGEAAAPSASQNQNLFFWMLIVFLVLEYARPPGIVQLRLQMLISLVLPVVWLSDRANRPWSPILGAQVAFLAICALAVPFAWNNYAAYFTTRMMFGNVAMAISMSWLLADPGRFRQGMWAWLLIMTYVALWSLTHGGFGTGGFLGDENDLALACVTAFPFAFFGFERLSGWRRWASGGIGVTLVLAVVQSFSRGGFVGLAAAGAYCFMVSRHKIRNLMVILVSAAAFVLLAPASYLEELTTIPETSEGTAHQRQFLWATAVEMWKGNPVLGVGGGNFSFLAGQYQPPWGEAQFLERDWSGTTVHSAYFEVLSEQGSIGAALAIYIIWAHFASLRRLRRRARSSPELPFEARRDIELYAGALGGAMVGFLVSGAFVSVSYYPFFWYFSALSVALEAAYRSGAGGPAIDPAGDARQLALHATPG